MSEIERSIKRAIADAERLRQMQPRVDSSMLSALESLTARRGLEMPASATSAMRSALDNLQLRNSLDSVFGREQRSLAALQSYLGSVGLSDVFDTHTTALQTARQLSLGGYLKNIGVLESARQEFFEGAVSSVLGNWQRAFGPTFAEDLAEALTNAQRGEEITLADAVAEAVADAVQQSNKRTDWRFVMGLVISMLILLVQWQADRTEELKGSIEAVRSQVERTLLQNEEILQLLRTREVARWAKVYTGPNSKSRLLGVLEPGTSVIVLARRNKWTRVGLSSDERAAGAQSSGWVLNKYLK